MNPQAARPGKHTSRSPRNYRIDALKGLAIIAVVVAHTGWHAATAYTDALPLSTWLCVVFFLHASVPVFMLLTGYFYDSIFRRRRAKGYITRLLWLGVVGCVLLAISDIFFGPELYDALTARSWLRFLLLGEYPLGAPMWFIPAIIEAFLLMLLTDKAGLWPKAAWYIVGLGAVGMVLSQLPYISPCWGRNALFMGFPLVALGRLIKEKQLSNSPLISLRAGWIILAVGMAIVAVESIRIIRIGYPLPFTAGLLIAAIGALLVAVSGQENTATDPHPLTKGLSSLGNHSGEIYVIHGAITPLLAYTLPDALVYLTGALPAVTLTGSWLIAILFRRLRSRS